jgi:subfamily B ATP-binding cassette protein MsbA
VALAVVLYIASTPGMVEKLSAGVFINVVFCMVMLLKPLKQLTTINNEFQKGMTACVSVFEILDRENEADSGDIKLERAVGKIEFDDVTFTYPGKHSPALTNVSFTAEPGHSVALVGRSGSGKSTISSLLTRFYSPQRGQVRLDDNPLDSIDLKSLRAQFAVVSQNVTLFNDSIANNIAYGAKETVSQAKIEQACKMAHVDEFLGNLPEGIDTVIGENGLMLSGGQRQRIAIARAILADAPILILDEATSALDTESERLIQDALETLQKRCTSIVVAHRLSTIENADTIMVVEQGRIIESGKHQELLEKGGHYAQLHALQFGDN